MDLTTVLVPAGYGWLAGLRNFTAPATAAIAISRSAAARGGLARALRTPLALFGLPVLAAAELLVVDKLRRTPDRTYPPILATRVLSGAIAGAAMAQTTRSTTATTGAAVGAAFAVLGSYLGLWARRAASRRLGTTEQRAGWAEDGVALGLGAALVAAAR